MSSHPIRRGLPRTPGGEPWPPTGGVPIPAEDTAAPQPLPRPDEQAVAAAAAVAPDTAATAGVPQPARAPRGAGAPVRRGLPRTAGGDPWPQVGSPLSVASPPAPAAAAASTDVAPAAAPDLETPAPTAPGRRRGLPRPASSAPPAAPTEAVRASAAPTAATGAPDSAATAVPASPSVARAPLPFTPAVWPGAAASGPRGPRPEPVRHGPFTRVQWVGAVIVAGGGLLFAAAMAVLAVRWLVSLDALQDFLAAYPGEYHLPEGAPVGFPAWLGWQHFLNTFFILLIIRSGLRVRREARPVAFWTPRWNSKRKISLALWFHQCLDILWIVNGVLFIVLLFVSGQWMRIVPTSWEVFPNAVSAALQYVSLDWPTENGWVNYNSLQQIAYFTTVFIAAPLAIVTGVRMSGIWPTSAKTLNRLYPLEWARAVHFPVMLYFVAFIIVHVALVFATGALRNLNHMYAAQDAVNWTGFWIFLASMLVLAAGWVAARPLVLAPIAGLFGTVKGR